MCEFHLTPSFIYGYKAFLNRVFYLLLNKRRYETAALICVYFLLGWHFWVLFGFVSFVWILSISVTPIRVIIFSFPWWVMSLWALSLIWYCFFSFLKYACFYSVLYLLLYIRRYKTATIIPIEFHLCRHWYIASGNCSFDRLLLVHLLVLCHSTSKLHQFFFFLFLFFKFLKLFL